MTTGIRNVARKKSTPYFAIILLTIIIIVVVKPNAGPRYRGFQSMSMNRLSAINAHVQLFRQKNDGLPPNDLTELAENLTDTRFLFFACPYTHAYMPIEKTPVEVNVFSPYRLVNLDDGRSVIFEANGLWDNGSIGYCVTHSNSLVQEPELIERIQSSAFEQVVIKKLFR